MNVLNQLIAQLSTFVIIAGGLWAAWGLVMAGFGIAQHEGTGIRNGVLNIVGGALVITAAGIMKGLVH